MAMKQLFVFGVLTAFLAAHVNLAEARDIKDIPRQVVSYSLLTPVVFPVALTFSVINEPAEMLTEIKNEPLTADGGVPEKLVKGMFAIPAGVTVGLIKTVPRTIGIEEFIVCHDYC